MMEENETPVRESRFAYQPEYKRQQCTKCGNWYVSGKGRLDTGLCEPCARANGLYVQTRIATR